MSSDMSHVMCYVTCHVKCLVTRQDKYSHRIQKYILEHQNQVELHHVHTTHSDSLPRMLKYPQVCERMTLQPQAFFKCVPRK